MATLEDNKEGDPEYNAVINRGGRSEIMTLHRLTVEEDGVCRLPVVSQSPQVDASMIYGPDEGYLNVCYQLKNCSCLVDITRSWMNAVLVLDNKHTQWCMVR